MEESGANAMSEEREENSLPVLLVDGRPQELSGLAEGLEQAGFPVRIAESGGEGLELAMAEDFAAVLTEYRLEGSGGLEIIERLHEAKPLLPVFLMNGAADSTVAIRAVQAGACDFLPKPVDATEFLALLDEALAGVRAAATRVVAPSAGDRGAGELMGRSRAMAKVYRDLAKLAATPVTVLIRGETGTGKELVARALHKYGHRSHQPLVTVNCAAIPEHLLESELFGHEKGAFTGAVAQRVGKFEQAHGATLFLDEIGDMDLSLQAKMLRVLQERQIQRVGGRTEIPVDVRIIAATHQPLEQMVQEGRFREDLFYRLNAASLWIPPLRDRFGDVDVLVEHFLSDYGHELGVEEPRISKGALTFLASQAWPGNVRQLQNVLRRALVKRRQFVISREDVDELMMAEGEGNPPPLPSGGLSELVREVLDEARQGDNEGAYREMHARVDEILLREALRQSGGNQARAARWLGITRYTLREKLKNLPPTT